MLTAISAAATAATHAATAATHVATAATHAATAATHAATAATAASHPAYPHVLWPQAAAPESAAMAQALALTTGLLLLTAVLQLWRRSLSGSTSLLAIQGAALAGLVITVAIAEGAPELFAVALLVLALKAAIIPMLLHRTALKTGGTLETSHRVHPTAGLLWAALLTTVAFLAARPLVSASPGPLTKVAPVGLALVLLGFLVLLTRHQAVSQLVGFVILDNGIATVAFLTSGGVPLVVEIGVMIDVLFVVVILRVLASQMRSVFGATDLDDLTELRD